MTIDWGPETPVTIEWKQDRLTRLGQLLTRYADKLDSINREFELWRDVGDDPRDVLNRIWDILERDDSI